MWGGGEGKMGVLPACDIDYSGVRSPSLQQRQKLLSHEKVGQVVDAPVLLMTLARSPVGQNQLKYVLCCEGLFINDVMSR